MMVYSTALTQSFPYYCIAVVCVSQTEKVYFVCGTQAMTKLLHNPVRSGLNHVVDALGSAGGVEDDTHIGRHAVFVVLSVGGDGAACAETIGPTVG